MTSISGIGPSTPIYATHGARSVGRGRTHTESTKSSLTLQVRTAEGDTVELSVDAISLKQLESGKARTSNGKASYSNATQSSSYNFNARIAGDLNDQELSDVVSLIHSLQTGHSPATSLTSLAAYTGAFQQTTSVSNSTFRLYA